MIFLELVLQNFGPYRGRQVLNLCPETTADFAPILLLGGMNGGGKTTLMDALRLALYGNRAQCSTRGNLGYGDFLQQCVNRNSASTEETRIELLMEQIINDTRSEVRIVRHWHRYDKEGKDNLGVLRDDWLDTALTNTWDEYIENVLPLGISNLFLFDGEQVKELAELDAPPPSVVDAIQSLLGLELAEQLAVDLEVLITRKRKAFADAKELAELEAIEQRLADLEQDLEQHKVKQVKLQENIDQANKKKQEAWDKFVLEGGQIKSEQTELKKQVKELTQEAEETRDKLRNLATGILPLAWITPLLEQAQESGKQELGLQEAKVTRNVIKGRDQRLLNYINQLNLKLEQVQKITEFLQQENQELEAKITDNAEPWLDIDPETLASLNTLLTYEIPQACQRQQGYLETLERLDGEMMATETELATAASPEDFTNLETQLKKAQELVGEAQVAYRMGEKKRQQLESAIAQTRKELATYSDKIMQKRSSEHLINSITKAQDTLKLFKERLTLKKLNKLEIEVADCFRYLLHKSDLVHRLSIASDNFSLTLYNLDGEVVPKHRLSAGEKQLLAIAFLWGLARVSGRRLPVAIDTPLGRLDSSHRHNLVERYFPNASHQVILLSTDTEIGQQELQQLREAQAIAREYLLHYNPSERQTSVKPGYFW
jgi:DNA sulfur modification protein DndD